VTFWFGCHFSVDINPLESFLRGGQKPTLSVQSTGHGVHIFINGQYSGMLNLTFLSN
jgi:hypothetical protein